MPFMFDTIVEEIGLRLNQAPPFVWVNDEPTDKDLQDLHAEAFKSDFDIHKLKRNMIEEYKNGKAILVCKSGPYAKIVALVYTNTIIPWDSFSLIFKAVDRPKEPFRIFWFASRKKRMFPQKGIAPDMGDINGGYTYPCDTQSIVIYREEEVCRVLIHEILHATCTDIEGDIVDLESYTEAWAELFWVAILSKGNKKKASRLWKEQAQWISNKEYSLRMNHRVNSKDDYVWRYTIGRRKVLYELGILLPEPNTILNESLSLTAPNIG